MLKLRRLRPYKTTVIDVRLAAVRSMQQGLFLQLFLQPVVEGEIDPQLTFFSGEAWFHLQGYVNTQNSRS